MKNKKLRIITVSEVNQLMEEDEYNDIYDNIRQRLTNEIISSAKQGERVCYYEHGLPDIILKELEDAGYITSYGFFSSSYLFLGYKIEW